MKPFGKTNFDGGTYDIFTGTLFFSTTSTKWRQIFHLDSKTSEDWAPSLWLAQAGRQAGEENLIGVTKSPISCKVMRSVPSAGWKKVSTTLIFMCYDSCWANHYFLSEVWQKFVPIFFYLNETVYGFQGLIMQNLHVVQNWHFHEIKYEYCPSI